MVIFRDFGFVGFTKKFGVCDRIMNFDYYAMIMQNEVQMYFCFVLARCTVFGEN